MNAILYLLKTGCQWRMIPGNFASWESVYYYFSKWKNEGIFEELLDKLRSMVRIRFGRNESPSMSIIDSRSVRTSHHVDSVRRLDGNKKIKGRKQHIIVDSQSYLMSVTVHEANIHDSKAAYLLMRVLKEPCSEIKVILADGGYRGELVENVKNKFGYVIQVVISAYKEQGFKPIHKRWIVERTFSWMENYRRLCRNYELTFDSAEEMVKISATKLLLKKI